MNMQEVINPQEYPTLAQFKEDVRMFDGEGNVFREVEESKYHGPRTQVVIFDKQSGLIVGKAVDHNKMMLSGSEFMAMRMFDLDDNTYTTPTYNNQMNLDNSLFGTDNDLTLDYKAWGFCIGISGCGRGSFIKYETSNKKWIAPDNDIIPFRYCKPEADLDALNRTIYFGRKDLTSTKNRIAYYFKKFDSIAVVNKEYEDGTPWTSNVYSVDNVLDAHVKVTATMSIDNKDGRDYFLDTTGINDARFNCAQVVLGWPSVQDDVNYYQDIRPCSRINFPNRVLSDRNTSWEIIWIWYF